MIISLQKRTAFILSSIAQMGIFPKWVIPPNGYIPKWVHAQMGIRIDIYTPKWVCAQMGMY